MRSMLTILCLFATSAHAVPGQFTHQGRLLHDDGTPKTGDATITFRVMNGETDGEALWTETQDIPLNNGFYAAVLGVDEADNPLDTEVLQQGPVWLELQLEGEPAMSPRSPIHAVPYATISTVANSVSGGPVDASEITVDGTPVVDASGNWVGPAPTIIWDDIAGMPAGFADGVDDESDSFAALGVSCMDGETPVWDAVMVEWACGIDMVLSESEVDAMVADNGYATTTDTEALLERIEQLENQLAEVADDGDDSDSSTVMYGDYNIDNSADLNALSGFEEVSGNLTISGNMPHIEPLASLQTVGGNLNINEGTALTSLTGLDNLTSIGGELTIINDSLGSLSGLHSLQSANNIQISSDSITSLSGLNSLETVTAQLYVNGNANLESLDGLDSLTTVADVYIYDNPALASVAGLGGITSIAEQLNIQENNALTAITGLGSLTTVGNLYISHNDTLTDLAGLSGLTQVNGSVSITANDSLVTLSGLDGITAISEEFTAQRNESLLSLEGLSGLQSVNTFTIQINDSLESLDGLDSLESMTGHLTIFANDSLCRSAAMGFLAWLETLGLSSDNINSNRDC